MSFIWGQWCPCFKLLVMSAIGFKARVDPSLTGFLSWMQRILQIHLWCDTCWPLDGQHGSGTFLDPLTCVHVYHKRFYFFPVVDLGSTELRRQLNYTRYNGIVVFGTVESATNCTTDLCSSCRSQCGKFAGTPIFLLEVNEQFHESVLFRQAGRALTSDTSVNSFKMDVCEKNFSRALDRKFWLNFLLDKHYRIIYKPVRSECSSCRMKLKWN